MLPIHSRYKTLSFDMGMLTLRHLIEAICPNHSLESAGALPLQDDIFKASIIQVFCNVILANARNSTDGVRVDLYGCEHKDIPMGWRIHAAVCRIEQRWSHLQEIHAEMNTALCSFAAKDLKKDSEKDSAG